MTIAEAPKMPNGFVVGERASITIGLRGTVTEKGDGTVTIDGVTVPTRLMGPDGPLMHMTTEWPPPGVRDPELDEREHNAVRSDDDPLKCENLRLLDAIAQLHDENHTGPLAVCLHEVCRRWGR